MQEGPQWALVLARTVSPTRIYVLMYTRWSFFLPLLLSALLALGGCHRPLYTSATPPMPLHEDRGEVHLAGQRTLDGSKQGFVSATPANHLIVYGSYLQSPSLSSFYEGGAGTYVRLNNPATSSPLLLEAMVG